MQIKENKLYSQHKKINSSTFYNYPTLIEPMFENNIKDYKVVGQDNSLPYALFYGTYDECVKWRYENCR
jgi:hypothetical protein